MLDIVNLINFLSDKAFPGVLSSSFVIHFSVCANMEHHFEVIKLNGHSVYKLFKTNSPKQFFVCLVGCF